jgi:hypothetical protein
MDLVGEGSISNGARDAVGVIEDAYFIEPPKTGRFSRALWLLPGDYSLFVAMRERPAKGMPRTVVHQQPLSAPDLSKDLAISSLILADSIAPAARVPNARQQVTRPYSIGGTDITPAVTTQLRNAAELLVVFFVYNPTAGPDNKPDIQVDYTFLQRVGNEERALTASRGQRFDADTLPKEFNLASGHQLMAGQRVPLAGFPAGPCRLRVTVTDNVSRTSTTGDLNFSVTGE